MHEAAFAHAALPRRAVILKLPMRVYSNAHELWLWRRGNPFVTDTLKGGHQTIERRHLVEAALICCHTHAELMRIEEDWLLWFKTKIWRWRIRKILASDDLTALAIAEFRIYRAEGCSEPATLEARQNGKIEHQRAAGAPFILRLLQFVMLVLGKTEAEALAYPHGLSVWHYCAHYEREGALRIQNADEQSADNEINRAKYYVAQGLEPGEALRKARDEETDTLKVLAHGQGHQTEATCPT